MKCKQKLLILGSTGLLGQALVTVLSDDFNVFGVARKNADFNIDITDDKALAKTIKEVSPDIIINTVAIVNHSYCENNPAQAYMVNSRPVSVINSLIGNTDIYFIQISTDHYYKDDIKKQHNENDPIILPSEYSKTKYLAEQFALLNPKNLVLRTNVVGFRGDTAMPSFLEWVLESLKTDQQITLFNDFYTSSIHTMQLAEALKKLIPQRISGILNIASSEVASKKEFIEAFALKFGLSLKNTKIGTCKNFEDSEKRGDSLGLDISRAQNLLEYKLPNLEAVVESLLKEYLSKYNRSAK